MLPPPQRPSRSALPSVGAPPGARPTLRHPALRRVGVNFTFELGCSTHPRSAPHPPLRGRCGAPTMQAFGKEARAAAGIVLGWKSASLLLLELCDGME